MSEKQTTPKPHREIDRENGSNPDRELVAEQVNVVKIGDRRHVFLGDSATEGRVFMRNVDMLDEVSHSLHYAFRTQESPPNGPVTCHLISIVPSTRNLPTAQWRFRDLTVKEGIYTLQEWPMKSMESETRWVRVDGTLDGEVRSFTSDAYELPIPYANGEDASDAIINGKTYVTAYDHSRLTDIGACMQVVDNDLTEDERARVYLAGSVLSELAKAIARSRAAKEGREADYNGEYTALIDILSGAELSRPEQLPSAA